MKKEENSDTGMITRPADQNRAEAIQSLIAAGKRENTSDTYKKALKHYENDFGGSLPSTPQAIAGYIDYCVRDCGHAVSTIETRLAAISVYHRDRRLPNPVRTPEINAVLKGLRAKYNRSPDKAVPITLEELQRLAGGLEHACLLAAEEVRTLQNQGVGADGEIKERSFLKGQIREAVKLQRQALRDRAFFLIGFWFGYRSDELIQLRFEHCLVNHHRTELSCFLPSSKGDRESQGESKSRSSLVGTEYEMLCPVVALEAWQDEAGVNYRKTKGVVFSKIDRWGTIGNKPLHSDSIVDMMRRALVRAGFSEDDNRFTSHSLRRGFAHWVVEQGGDVAALMSLVGWSDPKTAAGYVKDSTTTFDRLLSNSLADQERLTSTKPIEMDPRKDIDQLPEP